MTRRPRLLLRIAAGAAVVAVLAGVAVGGIETEHDAVSRASASRSAGALNHQQWPEKVPDFQRFRLGPIDGERPVPNRMQSAGRTVDNGPLLLFLPATRAAPRNYQLFLATALSAGYHVLGLDYWNLGRTLSGTCGRDPRCYTQVQRNRFSGVGPTEFSDVARNGSILARLRTAITHLEKSDPAGGWNRYLRSDGSIRWRNIVVAGHSQGGGEAAYIAHVRSVAGVLMFSSPVESDGRYHAAWMNKPGKTPVSRMYALDDVHDWFGPKIRGAWRAMGLEETEGVFRTVTKAPAAGDDPHAILTRLRFPAGGRAHSWTINDRTPRTSKGIPTMLPLWHWMLTRFPLPATHGGTGGAGGGDPTATAVPSSGGS